MISTGEQYVTFVLGDETYAVPVVNIREIVRPTKITRIPFVPDHVEGVMNLRGEILPVINLRKMLHLPPKNIESSKIVVLIHEDNVLGVVVDRTSQVIRSSREEQQESSTQSSFVTKVIKTNIGLCLLLDTEKLFQIQSHNHELKVTNVSNNQVRGDTTKKQGNHIQLVTFELSSGIYAFKIDSVQEIIRYIEPNVLPGAPEYIKGLVELREKVLPIIDLRRLLELPCGQIDEYTKIIVLKISNVLVGVIVDRIREVLRLEESRLLPPPSVSQEGSAKELLGIVQSDREMIMVLDHRILLAERIQHFTDSEQERIEREKTDVVEEEKQYVIFEVSGEEYGVQIEEIREINRLATLTRIPKAPEYLVGLMNLRGEVIPVIDLRRKFGFPIEGKSGTTTRVIVTESSGRKTAFVVDSVMGVQRISSRCIVDMPEMLSFGESSRFVSKIARIDDRVILLLQMERILTEQEQRTVQKTIESRDASKEGKKSNFKHLK